jgi:hypothetical protein
LVETVNAKLDSNLLRATSAEHAVECGVLPSGSHPRLELVPECPRAAVSYAETRWERLDRDQSTIIFASSPALDRVGVTAFYAGKYVSYRECSREEAREAVGQFQRVGFSGPRPFEVKP